MLTITNLTKRYAGKRALNGLSMSLPQGKIIGLLGPNGSGKTTLMKTIAGLLTPDAGEIYYPWLHNQQEGVQKSVQRGVQSKNFISFLPDSLSFPGWMKVSDAFKYFEDMYPDYDSQKADAMQKLLELFPKYPIDGLSKGMRERVGLALTFSRIAPLYLLDEPLGGIDPVGRHKVLQSIIATHRADSSILLSTHLIKDVETVFDCVFFIKEGKIVFEGDCEDLRRQHGKKVEDLYLEVFGGV